MLKKEPEIYFYRARKIKTPRTPCYGSDKELFKTAHAARNYDTVCGLELTEKFWIDFEDKITCKKCINKLKNR